jgi:hypothetical protein
MMNKHFLKVQRTSLRFTTGGGLPSQISGRLASIVPWHFLFLNALGMLFVQLVIS